MQNILGINISTLSKKDVLKKISFFLEDTKPHYIITPNPEIILKATGKDEEYFHILNKADIAVADGFGLKIAAWLKLGSVPRITGADLLLDVLKLLNSKNKRVLVLNWKNGLSTKNEIVETVNKSFPNLILHVTDTDNRGKDLNHEEIDKFAPDFIFVNFGAPYQEKYIFHNLHSFSSLRCAIGIGGAFDFLTGKIRRAPVAMRYLGLEWLFRLIKQPKRYKRIFNATIVFFYKFLIWNFIKPHLYRPNVACLAYKKENHGYKVLLVKRSHRIDHWQLPQGGTDNEPLKVAGLRELKEELNNGNFKHIASFKNLYKYKFHDSYDSSGVKSVDATGYKGQKQGLTIAEFTGKDEDITLNYFDHKEWRWVDSDKLLDEIHECRIKSTKIFLQKFKETIKNHK